MQTNKQEFHIINLEQDSPEWHSFRQNGVGASDVASIAGIEGAFMSRNEVMLEKLGKKKKISDYQEKIFTDGKLWEEEVRTTVFNNTEYKFKPAVVQSMYNSELFASLDGLDLDHKMILEVKSVVKRNTFEKYCSEVPAHYKAQVQWQLMITGYDAALIAFVHDGEVVVKSVEADLDMQRELLVSALSFLEELKGVKAGTEVAKIQTEVKTPDVTKLMKLKIKIEKANEKIKAIEEEAKELSEKILRDHKAVKVENDKICIQIIERKGSVNYSAIPELKNVDLDKYRGKTTTYIQTKLK